MRRDATLVACFLLALFAATPRAAAVCTGWSCPPSYWGSADGCDCECGCWDPDCGNPNAVVWNCAVGQACVSPGRCESNTLGLACVTPLPAALGTNAANGTDQWFSFTATIDGTAVVSSAGSGEDTLVYVYDDCGTYSIDVTDGVLGDFLARNDDAAPDIRTSRVAFAVLPGVTYRILWAADHGPQPFAWTIAQVPRETNCTNGLDDDGDGAIDCADADCGSQPACGGCFLTIELYDTVGNGWDGARLTLRLNGAAAGTFLAPPGQRAYTRKVAVRTGDVFGVEYSAGSFEEQHSYRVLDAARNVLFADGPRPTEGAVFGATVDCAAVPLSEVDCADGVDNEGDGRTDCADPECFGQPDCVESACANGRDDDRDGLTDCADPDCAPLPACAPGASCGSAITVGAGSHAATGADEWFRFTTAATGTVVVSSAGSGRDTLVRVYADDCTTLLASNDDANPDVGDYTSRVSVVARFGTTVRILWDDANGPGPFAWTLAAQPATSELLCGDGADDDGDGKVDCADEDCVGSAACGWCTYRLVMTDSYGDGWDGARLEVRRNGQLAGTFTGTSFVTTAALTVKTGDTVALRYAAGGADDEVAYALLDAAGNLRHAAGPTPATGDVFAETVDCDRAATSETLCDDGVDNDRNGDTDCLDLACSGTAACVEAECSDRIDNDGDGRTDCADDDCDLQAACIETLCDDRADNDGDGLVDCADDDCQTLPTCGPGGTCASALPARAGTNTALGSDQWFVWTATVTGSLTVSSAGTTQDTFLRVFESDCRTVLDSNDNIAAPLNRASRVVVPVVAGRTYVILWDDAWSPGPFTWTLTEVRSPTEVECADGRDDDGDGRTDCADPDCATSRSCGAASGESCDRAVPLNGGAAIGAGNDGLRLTVAGTTRGATDDLRGSCADGSQGAPDLVYSFLLSAEMVVSIDHDFNGDTFWPALYVFREGCVAAREVACATGAADAARVSGRRLAPGRYFVVVDGAFPGDAHTFSLSLAFNVATASEVACGDSVDNDADGHTDCADSDCAASGPCKVPDNDRCTAAEYVIPTSVVVLAGSTRNAGTEYEPTGGPDVWYAFTLTQDMRVDALMSTTPAWDTWLYLLRGTCADPVHVVNADGGGGAGESRIIETLAAGSYFLVASGARPAETGPFTLTLRFAPGTAERCADGTDQDGDGLTDCADPYCASDAACLGDTCRNPRPIGCGDCLTGTTAGRSNAHVRPWGHAGPDMVYELVLAERRNVRLVGGGSYDADWGFARTCDLPANRFCEIGCWDFLGSDPDLPCGSVSADPWGAIDHEVVLGPGTYYVWVDGYGPGDAGAHALQVVCGPPELCDDGQDNDGDGLVDCADDQCALDLACLPDGCDYALTLTDTFADGWEGAFLTVAVDGAPVATHTVAHGRAAATETVRVQTGHTLSVSYTGGTPRESEHAWELRDAAGNRLHAAAPPPAVGLAWSGTVDCNAPRLEDCADGRDDDGDGATDCDDPDCAVAAICQPGRTCARADTATLGVNAASGEDQWFVVTASATGALVVTSEGAGVDTRLQVLADDCVTVLGANDDVVFPGDNTSRVSIDAAAGRRYRIFWDDAHAPGPFTWRILEQPVTTETSCIDGIDNDGDGQTDCADGDCSTEAVCGAPSGERCDTAIPLHGGVTIGPANDGLKLVARGTTVGASADLSGTCAAGSAASPDRVYRFQLAAPMLVRIEHDFAGTYYQPAVYLYAGACTAANQGACATARGDGAVLPSRPLAAGTWYVVVDGAWPGDAFDYTLTLDFRRPAASETACADGVDEDADGATDCSDPDCRIGPPCSEANCADGVDEDGDGATDCADPDCAQAAACREGNCTNGVDDDRDGLTDCADADCRADPTCRETLCDNGIDDEGDGYTDCADSDCAAAPACAGPDGERCATAIPLNGGVPLAAADAGRRLTIRGDTRGAAADLAASCGAGSAAAPDRVYLVNLDVPLSLTLRHDFDGLASRPAVALFRGACASADETACALGSGGAAVIGPQTLAAGTWYILVDGRQAGDANAFTLTVDVALPEACADGLDNDGDALADCADPDCAGAANCQSGWCSLRLDLRDTYGDGWDGAQLDVTVGGQARGPFLVPEGAASQAVVVRAPVGAAVILTYTAGSYEADHTYTLFDGRTPPIVAFADGPTPRRGRVWRGNVAANCALPGGPLETCDNGRDDDADGAVDCDDPDCAGSEACGEVLCGDGNDDDGDGLVDCADSDCAGSPLCAPGGYCANAVNALRGPNTAPGGSGPNWFVFTAPIPGDLTITSRGSGEDTALYVYESCATYEADKLDGRLTNYLVANDDIAFPSNTASEVSFTTRRGGRYYILWAGTHAPGPFLFTVRYDRCYYALEMHDSGGDGWEGASVRMFVNGLLSGEAAASGFGRTGSIAVRTGDRIVLDYRGGTANGENSFSFHDAANNVLYTTGPPPPLGFVWEGRANCESASLAEVDCTDGIDNENDGFVDCCDSECAADPACQRETACSDGLDSDCDGLTDCDDLDCVTDLACVGDRCVNPLVITCGECITDTSRGFGARHDCGAGHGGPDVLYALQLNTRMTVTLKGSAEYDADWTFARDCGDRGNGDASDLLCADFEGSPLDPSCASFTRAAWSHLNYTSLPLDAGTYYIWVDTFSRQDAGGRYALEVECTPHETECADGRDDDGDGRVDCADSDCEGDPACGGCTYQLAVRDSAGDGWQGSTVSVSVDGIVVGEYSTRRHETVVPLAVRTGELLELTYTRGVGEADNSYALYDAAGNRLFADGPRPVGGTVYRGAVNCAAQPLVETDCIDGVDNENDGLTDCADPDCRTSGLCVERDCADGRDDDGDGRIDCADPDCAGLAPCCGDDVIAGNDTFARAYPLSPPSSLANLVAVAGAPDYFAIPVCAGGRLQVAADFLHAGGDIDLFVYSATGATLAAAQSGSDDETLSWRSNVDGTVYVEVAMYTPRACNTYALAVSFDASSCTGLRETNCANGADDDGDGATDCADADCATQAPCTRCPDDALEPNDGRGRATAVPPVATIRNLVSAAGNPDWYAVPVCAGGTLLASVEFLRAGSDIDLYLLDANGQQLDVSLNTPSAGQGTWVVTDREAVAWDAATTGTVYLLVHQHAPNGCSAYTLDVAFDDTLCGVTVETVCDDGIDNDGDGAADCSDSDCRGVLSCCKEDRHEPNDSLLGARPLPQIVMLSGLVAVNGDDDWFSVPVCTGGTLDVDVSFAGADGAVHARLFDADGVPRGTRDISEDLVRLRWEATYDGLAFVRILVDDVRCNDYSLDVRFDRSLCRIGRETSCDNGRDDDGDFLVDCLDSDCQWFAPCCRDDDAEPNDTLRTATPTVATDTLGGLVAVHGNDDWFAIPVCLGGRVETAVRFDAAAGDIDIILRDRSGRPLVTGASQTDEERVTWLSNYDGLAYLQVVQWTPDVCSTYTLIVDVDEAGCVIVPSDPFEEDDLPAIANRGVESARGLTVGAGDDDWFAVGVCAGGSVQVDLAFVHSSGDVDVFLRDEAGTLLASSATNANSERVTWTNNRQRPLVVFAQVTLAAGRWNTYDIDIATSGCVVPLPASCQPAPGARLAFTAPADEARIDLGLTPDGEPVTETDVTLTFDRVVPAGGTWALRLFVDDEPMVEYSPPPASVVLSALPSGAHTVAAYLFEVDLGLPPCGTAAEDRVRFYVSQRCRNDAECADDDPCTLNPCIGSTPAAPLAGRCRFGPAPDSDCCVNVEWCNLRGLRFSNFNLPYLCADRDGDSQGDCVQCRTAADCPLTTLCQVSASCSAAGVCQYVTTPGCCTSDSACNDGNSCTVDSCDLATGVCDNVADPACCIPGREAEPSGAPSWGCTAAGDDPCQTYRCSGAGATARCRSGPAYAGCCSRDRECNLASQLNWCTDPDGVGHGICAGIGADPTRPYTGTCTYPEILPECCVKPYDCVDRYPAQIGTCETIPGQSWRRCIYRDNPSYCESPLETLLVTELAADFTQPWFELFNPTAHPIDLRAWAVVDRDGDGVVIAAPTPVLLSPGGHAVLTSTADGSGWTLRRGSAVSGPYAAFGLLDILPGAGRLQVSSAAGVVQDDIVWDASWPIEIGHPTALLTPYADNGLPGNWRSSPGAGTPGGPNTDVNDILVRSAVCDDRNPCTLDICNLQKPNICTHARISGCCRTDAECDDRDSCTIDSCDAVAMQCRHERKAGCCTTNADCEDAYPTHLTTSAERAAFDQCALKVCVARQCRFGRDTSRPSCCVSASDPLFGCRDRNACTIDACVAGAGLDATGGAYPACRHDLDWDGDGVNECCRLATDCDDGDPSTRNVCNMLATGPGPNRCLYPDDPDYCGGGRSCDDGNPCTADLCCADAGTPDATCPAADRCIHRPIPGCCHLDKECVDHRACTVDACCDGAGDPLAGCVAANTCAHQTIAAGCCETSADCNGASKPAAYYCRTGFCIGKACRYGPPAADCCVTAADCGVDPCRTFSCVGHRCEATTTAGCCNTGADCPPSSDPCRANVCLSGRCTLIDVPNCCTDDNPDGPDVSCREAPTDNPCTLDYCLLSGGVRRCSHFPSGDPRCCASTSQCRDDGVQCTDVACTDGRCRLYGQPACVASGTYSMTFTEGYATYVGDYRTLADIGWTAEDLAPVAAARFFEFRTAGALGPDRYLAFRPTASVPDYYACAVLPRYDARGLTEAHVKFQLASSGVTGPYDVVVQVRWGGAWHGVERRSFSGALAPQPWAVALPPSALGSDQAQVALCVAGASTSAVSEVMFDDVIVRGGLP
jgi:hypothetical protein